MQQAAAAVVVGCKLVFQHRLAVAEHTQVVAGYMLEQADCMLEQADCMPEQADCMLELVDCMPELADYMLVAVDCMPEAEDCMLELADCMPELADCMPEVVDCIPEPVDYKLELEGHTLALDHNLVWQVKSTWRLHRKLPQVNPLLLEGHTPCVLNWHEAQLEKAEELVLLAPGGLLLRRHLEPPMEKEG